VYGTYIQISAKVAQQDSFLTSSWSCLTFPALCPSQFDIRRFKQKRNKEGNTEVKGGNREGRKKER
jgi:hypothetical protein